MILLMLTLDVTLLYLVLFYEVFLYMVLLYGSTLFSLKMSSLISYEFMLLCFIDPVYEPV